MPTAPTPHDTSLPAGNTVQVGNREQGIPQAAVAATQGGQGTDGRGASRDGPAAAAEDAPPAAAGGQEAQPALRVAQSMTGSADPEAADRAAQVVAVVKEGGGNARVVRNGQSLSIAPGKVILMGDSIDTDGDAVRIEFTRASERGNGDKAMSVTIGAHSNLLIRAEAGEQSAVSFRMLAGAMAVENSPSQGEGVSIDTPFGRVVARGQGVGVSVNNSSGETTVLPIGARVAAGAQGDGVWVQSPGAASSMGVSGEGMVLHATTSARAAETPSAAQASVITSLVSSANPAPDAGTGPAAPGTSGPASPGAPAGSSPGAPASAPGNGSFSGSTVSSAASLAPISGSAPTGLAAITPAPLPALNVSGFIGSTGTASPQAETTSAPPVIPNIGIGSLRVDESAGFANVIITLSAVTTQIVTLTVTVTGTSDGRVASGVHTVTVPAGESSATLSLPIATDTVRQADGTIGLSITSVVNGLITQGEATVVVLDAAPMVAGPGNSVVTGGAGDD
jgi:hypothetical protein